MLPIIYFYFGALFLFIVTINLKTYRDARQAIAAWASDQDATIIAVNLPRFGGPFWYKKGITYIVTLGFGRDSVQKAWVFWPTWGSGERMQVQWMCEPI